MADTPSTNPAATDLAGLVETFGAAVLAHGEPLGEATALVAREQVVAVLTYLRDACGYQLLRSVTAVDYLHTEPRFHVVYHLVQMPAAVLAGQAAADVDDPARELRVKVPVSLADPVVPSVVSVYPGANFHEREVWDMFGLEFAGHPDLRRILMPPEFEGHPLRKDFPLRYEEIAFSFNQQEVHASKPRAQE
jgi:NADH-quinone oxidoreductase subunit C